MPRIARYDFRLEQRFHLRDDARLRPAAATLDSF